MKIGIVHRSDLADVRQLSGTPYFMAKALQKHVGEVIYLCPDTTFTTQAIDSVGKCADRLSRSLLGRHIYTGHHRVLAKRLAQTFGPRIMRSGCDVVFAPNASIEIASLSEDVPVVYLSDLNWANIVDYYPSCSSLFSFARKEGERIETAAIGKANALIYPSDWAANTAVMHYKANPEKVHCVPYGANLEAEEIPLREVALNHHLGQEINLLWVGVDWERKGGATAHACLMELLSRGTAARLTVCGCIPPAQFRHPKIEVIPFLNKRDPEQRRKMSELFLQANFFLFPTQADATPIVLCEASAHGLPTLVRETGGVVGAVVDGENGYLLPPDASGKHYAEKVLEIAQDHSRYDGLVRSSRKRFEDALNWDAWGRAVKPIFEQLVEGHKS